MDKALNYLALARKGGLADLGEGGQKTAHAGQEQPVRLAEQGRVPGDYRLLADGL